MPPIDADEELDVTASPTPTHAVHVHPLHVSYRYKVIPATQVLTDEVRKELDANDTVLVLDARASSELQLLARAWCAEAGYHALIGRASRTCLACCIREARGLGLRVIIRL